MESSNGGRALPHSHLFTLRLWQEPLGDGRFEWRGKVQYVLSGRAHYFRDWPALVCYLEEKLPELGAKEQPQHGDEPLTAKGQTP
jgi:hypothetical protein